MCGTHGPTHGPRPTPTARPRHRTACTAPDQPRKLATKRHAKGKRKSVQHLHDMMYCIVYALSVCQERSEN